jgi:hypoxanthine phosphoribosyltransferase
MKNLPENVLLSAEQIAQVVKGLATQLNKDYKHQTPVLVGVLNGSFIFIADLVRQLTFAPEICFVQLSSYEGVNSVGEVRVVKDIEIDVKGRSVLIVEDIVDTGVTVRRLQTSLCEKGAYPVRICTLLCRSSLITPTYVGMRLETNKFLVGYGLDLDNQFRNFPYIIETEMETNKE